MWCQNSIFQDHSLEYKTKTVVFQDQIPATINYFILKLGQKYIKLNTLQNEMAKCFLALNKTLLNKILICYCNEFLFLGGFHYRHGPNLSLLQLDCAELHWEQIMLPYNGCSEQQIWLINRLAGKSNYYYYYYYYKQQFI